MKLTRIISLIALLLSLVDQPLFAADKRGLDHLKVWVGKYPTYGDTKPAKSFFNLPEIQKPLKQLLNKKDFKHLTEELTAETPIEIVKDYLVIEVCYPHCCPCDNATLVVNLRNGGIHVSFYEHRGNKEVTRWFYYHPQDEYDELPKEILDELLHIHIPK